MNSSQYASTTPDSRIVYDANTSLKAKHRVDSADPNERRCLIENVPQERAVQYCHLIPRSFSGHNSAMTLLEWYWRMKHKSLNLDTRHNIFFAGSSLHFLHDANCWGLLPHQSEVKKYADSLTLGIATRTNFPDVPNSVFSYTLIPLSDVMKKLAITRQLTHPSDDARPTSDNFQVIVYPFRELPAVQSHIHPKFAIYELGRKLTALTLYPDKYLSLVQEWPILQTVLLLYRAWSAEIPLPVPSPPSFKSDSDPDSDDPNDGDYDGKSDMRTEHHRIRPTKRKTPHQSRQDGSPPPPPNRARKARDGGSLSHETLVDHEHLVGKAGWTRENLMDWVESVCPEFDDTGPESPSDASG